MSQADDVNYTDADLVTLLRAGNEEAISRLVEQWSPTMLRLARSFVASPQSAEDVVQEAWLGMLGGLARFEGRSSLRTWTFTILVNPARIRGVREARTVPGHHWRRERMAGPVLVLPCRPVPPGHHPGKRGAVQGKPAPARPGGVDAAATAAAAGNHP